MIYHFRRLQFQLIGNTTIREFARGVVIIHSQYGHVAQQIHATHFNLLDGQTKTFFQVSYEFLLTLGLGQFDTVVLYQLRMTDMQ